MMMITKSRGPVTRLRDRVELNHPHAITNDFIGQYQLIMLFLNYTPGVIFFNVDRFVSCRVVCWSLICYITSCAQVRWLVSMSMIHNYCHRWFCGVGRVLKGRVVTVCDYHAIWCCYKRIDFNHLFIIVIMTFVSETFIVRYSFMRFYSVISDVLLIQLTFILLLRVGSFIVSVYFCV